MEEIIIKIINQSDHSAPSYSTKDSAGMDIRANIANPITLKPLERTLVKTGLFMNVISIILISVYI